MVEDLRRLIQGLKRRRNLRAEQTLSDTSPVPRGSDSALTRQVVGVVAQHIITPALSRTSDAISLIPDQDQKRRTKQVKRWVKDTYNGYVKKNPDVYPHWSHDAFEQDILSSFVKGFEYFAQVASINDINHLRKPPEAVTRVVNGKRTQRIQRDERSAIQVISDAYKDRGDDPIKEYAIDTVSAFGVLFFHLLKAGVARGTPREDLLEMLRRTYGISEKLFEYEKRPPPPFNLDHKTVTLVCRQYPAQALKRFDAYEKLGERLITSYWGDPTPGVQTEGNSKWVASPAMIRNLILRHPDHVEKGLEIVDARLDSIFIDHKKRIPKDVIIDVCAEYGDAFENELVQIDSNVAEALDLYTCTDLSCDKEASARGERLFRYLQLEPKLYQVIARRRKGYVKVLSEAEKKYTITLQAAESAGFSLNFRSKRRIMELYISGKAESVKKILERERERLEQERRRFERLTKKADAYDPVWGMHYAIWGSGDSVDDRLKSGEVMITDVLRHYLGDNYTEAFLEHQLVTLLKYFNTGFKPESVETDRLKEALLMSPTSVRAYYDALSQYEPLVWPGRDEIPYDDSWQNNIEGEEEED